MMANHPYSLRRLATGGLVAATLLGGCRQAYVDRPIQGLLPRGAILVAEGRPPIGWLFRGGGSLYILDLDGNALVFRGTSPEISQDPRLIVVDPIERAVVARSIDTEVQEQHVLVRPIEPEHRFAIWFMPAEQQMNGFIEHQGN